MPPEAGKYLFDVRRACERIIRFTAGKSLAQYQNDDLTRAGVERQFEIIGEALGRLWELDPSLDRRITELRAIVAFRNRVIHGYDTIDDVIVWGIVEKKVPLLLREVQSLLGGVDPGLA